MYKAIYLHSVADRGLRSYRRVLLTCAIPTPIGKSSLAVQFVDGHFVESYYPTIENTFSKLIRLKGQDYATEIVDTAGQVCTNMAPAALMSLLEELDQLTSDVSQQ